MLLTKSIVMGEMRQMFNFPGLPTVNPVKS